MSIPDAVQFRLPPSNLIIRSLTVLVLSLSGFCSPTALPATVTLDQADDDFSFAVAMWRERRWDIAETEFRRFLEQNPEHPKATLGRMYLGLTLNTLEKYGPARDELRKVVAAEPNGVNAADARFRVGECSFRLNDHAAAIRELTEYLVQHTGHNLEPWGRILLSRSLAASERWQDSIDQLNRVIGDDTAEESLRQEARFLIARGTEAQGDADSAVAAYRKIADDAKDPFAPRALARTGFILFSQARYEESAAAYRQLAVSFPEHPLADQSRVSTGLALIRAGRFSEALTSLESVSAESSDAGEIALLRGIALRETDQTEAAREQFAEAGRSAGNSDLAPEVLYERAVLERDAGDIQLAARLFRDLADGWPADSRVPDSLFNAAELLLQQRDAAQAGELIGQLAKGDPQRASANDVRVLQARIDAVSGRTEKAIETLKQVAEAVGADPQIGGVAVFYLVRLLHDAEKHSEAARAAEQLTPKLDAPEYHRFLPVAAFAAISRLRLSEHAEAHRLSDLFLRHADTDASQVPEMLAVRAISAAAQSEDAAALADLSTLVRSHKDHRSTWPAVIEVAEAQWERQAFSAGAETFALTAQSDDPATRATGLSGRAWCLYRQQRFTEAAAAFQAAAEEDSAGIASAEALYMAPLALSDGGDKAAATEGFRAAFRQLLSESADRPNEVTAARSETPDPRRRYAFDSGLMAARLLSEAGEVAEADSVFLALEKAFPQSEQLDAVYDEWAALHLSAKQYDRADEIHRRLLAAFPESRFAYSARLSLAQGLIEKNRLTEALPEMRAIATAADSPAGDRERAAYHVVEILAAQTDWMNVVSAASDFSEQFPASDLLPTVRLLQIDGLLNQYAASGSKDTVEQAQNLVQELKSSAEQIEGGDLPAWHDRYWVAAAETAFAVRDYQLVDNCADRLFTRSPSSPFLFQMHDVLGRRWKQQAPPDFEKSREHFRKVVTDEHGRGTVTSARSQFQLAETYLMQQNYRDAQREYLRLVSTWPTAPEFDYFRSSALLQTARCELRLGQKREAARSLDDLIQSFPDSPLVAEARELKEQLNSPEG